MNIGYARISTCKQLLDVQPITDMFSGAKASRPG